MKVMAAVLQVLVGQPRNYPSEPGLGRWGRAWRSSIYRDAVSGSVAVTTLGLAGDAVADPRVHGGPDKAILVYSADHYPGWRGVAGLEEIGPGGFGENLTVRGLDESGVRIGDVYRIGTALLQVSEPRGPCWKLARRWRMPELPREVQRRGWTGWYLRVLEEGVLEAGVPVTLEDSDPLAPSVQTMVDG